MEAILSFLDSLMSTARGTTVWRSLMTLFVMSLVGMIVVAWKLLPANVDAAITNNATVVSHTAALVEAQKAVVAAQNEAAEAAKKADALQLTMQQSTDRIFSVLRDVRDGQSAAGAQFASINTGISDIKDRLTRVEAKQDAAK